MIHKECVRYNEPGHAHELTFSCYRRFRFLKAERTCQWLAHAIDVARGRWDFELWAFVFMPEHVHLIVRPCGFNPEFRIVFRRKPLQFQKLISILTRKCSH